MTRANAATIDLVMRDRQFVSRSANVMRVMQRLQDRMSSVAASARRVLMVGGAAATTFIALAAKQEMAEARLDAALVTTGHSLDRYSASAKAAASAIQDVTTYGDEAVMPLMAMALNLGVTADQLEHTTRMGIGLATALGQDAAAGIRNFVLAMSGEFAMLSRYLPAIRSTTNATEKFAMVSELAAKGFDQLVKTTATAAGRMIQFKNLLGDLGEALGNVLLPRIDKWVTQLKAFVPLAINWVKNNEVMLFSMAKWVAIAASSAIALKLIISTVLTLKVAFVGLGVVLAAISPAMAAMSTAAIALMGVVAAVAAANAYLRHEEMLLSKALQESAMQSVEAAKAWTQLQRARDNTKTAETEGDITKQMQAARQKVEAWRKLVKLEAGTADLDADPKDRSAFNKRYMHMTRILDDAESRLKSLEAAALKLRVAPRENDYTPTEEEAANQKAIRATIVALEEKLAVYGISDNEMQVREARRQNATENEIYQIRELQDALESKATAEKRADDAHKARFDLLREEAQMKADLHNALIDEADMYRDMVRTSAELRDNHLKRVDALAAAGKLATQEAQMIKERLIAEAAGRDAEREHAGQIEGLTATWSRIQAAAGGRVASVSNAASSPINQQANQAKATAQLVETKNATVESKSILSDIRALMQRLIDATPLAGSWS